MAYEVARVHGLIMSNIQDGEKDPTEIWPTSKSIIQMTPRLSPDTPLYDFPSDANQWSESSHSSSLESSTETETESDDEDDFIAGLAEQIAHSMLDDDEQSNATIAIEGVNLSGSSAVPLPHSRTKVVSHKVLSPESSWSPSSLSAGWSDSVSSSKQSSQVSSPPSTPFRNDGNAWDLLNAAAGEVGRLKMKEDRKPVSKPTKPTFSAGPGMGKQVGHAPLQNSSWRASPHPVQLFSPAPCNPGSRLGGTVGNPRDRFVATPHCHLHKSSNRPREDDRKLCNNGPAQHRFPKSEGVGWNQRKSSNPPKTGVYQKTCRQNYGYAPRSFGKHNDILGVPQRSGGQCVSGGSGMRAVFLGSAGSGRESGGTGVFFPRCVGAGSEHRRKPSCSTVLLPSRIVQVLNLNVEDMRTHPAPLPSTSSHGRSDCSGTLRNPPHMYMMELSSGASKYDGGHSSSLPRKIQGPHIAQCEPIEYSLPTEWTY